jgi:hypothetical protein
MIGAEQIAKREMMFITRNQAKQGTKEVENRE